MNMSTQLSYWLASLYLPGIGPSKLNRLITVFGNIKNIFDAPSESLTAFGLSAEQIQAISQPNLAGVECALRWAEEPLHHIVLLDDENYPPLLKEISDAPPLLFIAGNPQILVTPQIAIVGARHASPMGLKNAECFAHYLAQAGFTITSGLALGIDGASHRGALRAKGLTIGVTGTGLNQFYPPSHRALTQQIIDQGGAVVSEFALEVLAKPGNFPRRNRIISGLSLGVLVVEAALKSGSMITVKYALEQGREVFALPGSIHHTLAKGCHHLIRQGAKLVEEGQDIVEELGGFFYTKAGF